MFRIILFCAVYLATCTAVCPKARALPFNDDMVDIQPRTGLVMREQPKGSIAIGSLAEKVTDRESAKSLENPLKGDAASARNGERLFRVNCFPCHGNVADKNHAIAGPVGLSMPGPNITIGPRYTKDFADGDFFGVIHFGNVIMPALGWKLSTSEHWDIVNYIRKLQADAASDQQG